MVNIYEQAFPSIMNINQHRIGYSFIGTRTNADEKHDWDVSAVIGIAGQTKGAVVISFTKKLATLLTSILVNKEITKVEADVVDTIGEVVNIITGNAKKGLEEYRLMISLPAIIKGNNHSVAWSSKTIPIIGIPFSTKHGPFTLSVALGDIIKV